MSLDQLMKRTKLTHHVEKNVPMFFPPEYDKTPEQWRDLIQVFNNQGHPARLAVALQRYLREKYPEEKNLSGLISISPIVEKDGHFFADLSFENNKIGLTALVMFKAEDLQLVPILSEKGSGGVSHVSMTYVPD